MHAFFHLWLLWPNTGPLSANTPLSVSFRWKDPWEWVPDLDGPLICTNVSGSLGHTRIQIDIYADLGVLPNGLWPAEGSLLSFPQLILGCHTDAIKTTIIKRIYSYSSTRLRAKKGPAPPPPPREFRRHILSWRKFQAASFKRCLHSVLRGVSLWQPVTYVTVTN